ncbi:damage-control phosphatase ARMT1 family protein [Anaeromicropila populeti]|uniref:Damage-control phosphatase ARMT1-like metal-binding domain-containing protein n=1 Tax=Anaeromicropila populeti TaxID=37658 RepID=A0A1I6LPB4_9FIRM|nr:ARMT1-like domain-containing protein [Anaeromicropila populeti]SFS05347.1 hypothetical protein SAMN05661086_03472 [Anaeromicropila populeti]
MELFLDCLPCMLKQVLEAARMATEDTQLQAQIMERSIEILKEYRQYKNAPDLARVIHHYIKETTNVTDPYKKRKEIDLAMAENCYPLLKESLSKQEDKMYWALKIAAVGNNIDAAIYNSINMEQCVHQELAKEFAICDLDLLNKKLKTAKSILILGDNTGETIFDKVLIEQLTSYEIVYAVRSNPIINDVTLEDAYNSGLMKVSYVISSGCDAPGTILEYCSEEFIRIYQKADIIISKGQGNFETLSESGNNIFFLLKVKCPMIARRLDVELNQYVLKYKGTR